MSSIFADKAAKIGESTCGKKDTLDPKSNPLVLYSQR
jgi:hypothetical protein